VFWQRLLTSAAGEIVTIAIKLLQAVWTDVGMMEDVRVLVVKIFQAAHQGVNKKSQSAEPLQCFQPLERRATMKEHFYFVWKQFFIRKSWS
jgi:hypothetical protein